jgi:hypothetical protein
VYESQSNAAGLDEVALRGLTGHLKKICSFLYVDSRSEAKRLQG